MQKKSIFFNEIKMHISAVINGASIRFKVLPLSHSLSFSFTLSRNQPANESLTETAAEAATEAEANARLLVKSSVNCGAFSQLLLA